MNQNVHSADPIKTLSLLRLPLIIGVVLIHCNYLTLLPEDNRHVSTGFCDFMNIWKYVLSLCVPAFFFISGYFFFHLGLPDIDDLKSKLRRRFHTLMIPYILWNIIGMLCILVKVSPWFIRYFPQYSDVFNPWWRVLTNFYCLPHIEYPYTFVLWFIRNLIVVVLLTPLLTQVFRVLKLWSLIPIGIIATLQMNLYGLQSSLWFFSLGSLLAIYRPDLKVISRHTLVWLPLFILLVAVNMMGIIVLPGWIYETFGIFLLIGLFDKLAAQNVKWPPLLVNSTFFVYAFHGLFVTIANKSVLMLTAPFISGIFEAFATYLASFIILYGGSLAVYVLMKRLFPRVTSILTGNRS